MQSVVSLPRVRVVIFMLLFVFVFATSTVWAADSKTLRVSSADLGTQTSLTTKPIPISSPQPRPAHCLGQPKINTLDLEQRYPHQLDRIDYGWVLNMSLMDGSTSRQEWTTTEDGGFWTLEYTVDDTSSVLNQSIGTTIFQQKWKCQSDYKWRLVSDSLFQWHYSYFDDAGWSTEVLTKTISYNALYEGNVVTRRYGFSDSVGENRGIGDSQTRSWSEHRVWNGPPEAYTHEESNKITSTSEDGVLASKKVSVYSKNAYFDESAPGIWELMASDEFSHEEDSRYYLPSGVKRNETVTDKFEVRNSDALIVSDDERRSESVFSETGQMVSFVFSFDSRISKLKLSTFFDEPSGAVKQIKGESTDLPGIEINWRAGVPTADVSAADRTNYQLYRQAGANEGAPDYWPNLP